MKRGRMKTPIIRRQAVGRENVTAAILGVGERENLIGYFDIDPLMKKKTTIVTSAGRNKSQKFIIYTHSFSFKMSEFSSLVFKPPALKPRSCFPC